MKVRSGFVSNSSSSSFVVALERQPTSAIQVQEILFGPDQTYYSDPWNERSWGVAEVAATVLAQLVDGPTSLGAIAENMSYGYISSIYNKVEEEFPHCDAPEDRAGRYEWWRKRDERSKELASQYLQEFMDRDDVKGKLLFLCEFSDDSEYGSALEHGDLFDRVPHIHISNH